MRKRMTTTLIVAGITGIYIMLATLMMNKDLVWQTLVQPFPLTYKVSLLTALTQGMFTSMSGFGLLMLFLTGIFTGINIILLIQKFMFLHLSSGLSLTTGGSSLLGFLGSGCASCGVPLLSLFGLSGSILSLPFRGAEVSVVALLLLLLSFYLLLKSMKQPTVCTIR